MLRYIVYGVESILSSDIKSAFANWWCSFHAHQTERCFIFGRSGVQILGQRWAILKFSWCPWPFAGKYWVSDSAFNSLSSTCSSLFISHSISRETESSVGIVTYAMAGQPRNRSIPDRDKTLFSTTLSLGVKLPVRETGRSFPNAEARNRWRCTVERQSSEPSIIRTTVGKNKITV